jgi:Fe-S-cluster containining protein
LVSREEAGILLDALRRRAPSIQEQVVTRSRLLVEGVVRGVSQDFCCPLLLEEDGVPRCAAYEGRPYACRTFGHTARMTEEEGRPMPFTCTRLLPRVVFARAPIVPFRSQALRQCVGVETVEDSYIPIWVGLSEAERETRASGPGQAVVVKKTGT